MLPRRHPVSVNYFNSFTDSSFEQHRRAFPVLNLVQETRQLVEHPDAVVMLAETLPVVPSTTLSDFAIWKVNDSDELKYETEFKPSLYPAAATAMGFPVSVNRRKWWVFLLGILFTLAILPFFTSPTVHTVDIPKSWVNNMSQINYRGLPSHGRKSSKMRHLDNARPSIADREANLGSMVETFHDAAKYGLAFVFLPAKLMSDVKRSVSHWIGWLREAFQESIYVDLE